MTKHSWFGVLLSLFLLLAPAAQAQDDPLAAEWQAVITGQVEAFRAHDGTAALSFAGTFFQQNFPDPDAFMEQIDAWGYGAIMQSRSHSFGPFQQVEPNVVLQAVRFTGPDSILYDAVYQLNREEAGWRIGGVQMIKTAGMGA
jgi:hypothetical protein